MPAVSKRKTRDVLARARAFARPLARLLIVAPALLVAGCGDGRDPAAAEAFHAFAEAFPPAELPVRVDARAVMTTDYSRPIDNDLARRHLCPLAACPHNPLDGPEQLGFVYGWRLPAPGGHVALAFYNRRLGTGYIATYTRDGEPVDALTASYWRPGPAGGAASASARVDREGVIHYDEDRPASGRQAASQRALSYRIGRNGRIAPQ